MSEPFHFVQKLRRRPSTHVPKQFTSLWNRLTILNYRPVARKPN